MRYLVGTKEAINQLNEDIADNEGCNGGTTEWYATRATITGALCLLIHDDRLIVGSSEVAPMWPLAEI